MPKKSFREMNILERMRHSLGAKTFRTVLLLTIAISTAAIAFGFFLYSRTVNREYRTMTWNIVKSASRNLDHQEVMKEAAKMVAIYDSIPEEEKLDDSTEEYRAYYDEMYTDRFEKMRAALRTITSETSAIAAYTAALDIEHNRMIFIADGDDRDSFCPPGTWDPYTDEQLYAFMEGAPVNAFDALYDAQPMPAITVDMSPYGYRCIAGTKLLLAGKYPVFLFVDTDMNQVEKVSRTFLFQYIGLLLVIGLLFGFLVARGLRETVVKPINQLSEAAQAYSRDKMLDQVTGNHFENLNIRTGDELEALSLTMKDMEDDLADYVANLTRVTAEKERMNTELSVASQIQEGMIPHIFPPFPSRREFDLYALMDTAKEVGGDFYDYFLIDEDHLGLVMADVSGKGIPAALFMMSSMIQLRNACRSGLKSPAEILEKVNNQISESNDMEMFVTVWLGIIEISSGKMKAANAGHEYPAVMHDGVFSLYKDKHGFVIGGMEGMRYTEYEIQLSPGDKLFQYTDGVTEATNEDLALFGTDRMLDVLNANAAKDAQGVVTSMRAGIEGFVGAAPQFDDITMLCFEYKGNTKTDGKEEA